VIGKTEGNGGANDFTKDFAITAIQAALARRGADPAAPYFIMSGGCEGVMSPHMTYLVRSPEATGLTLGVARAGRQPAEELGRTAQVRSVAELVRRAQREAGIAEAADVQLVQVKCPTLSPAEIREAGERGVHLATTDPARSAALSRGASALGVALALGEAEEGAISDATISSDFETYTRAGCVSSEIGTDWHEVLVLGRAGAGDRYRAAHGVLVDALDADGARRVLAQAGIGDGHRLAALVAKCEPDPRGSVRGWRHTMLTDADVGAFRHIRGAVAAVLASVCGDPAIYVSGGAEHQGPLGGGTLTVIGERQ
jgi:cyanuric acid amidohydrolase